MTVTDFKVYELSSHFFTRSANEYLFYRSKMGTETDGPMIIIIIAIRDVIWMGAVGAIPPQDFLREYLYCTYSFLETK